jgi:hypothetical protein
MEHASTPIPYQADRRSAELTARERDLAVRAVSLSTLEARLAASGRRLERLEAKLRQSKVAAPSLLGLQVPLRRELPAPPPGYFEPDTSWDEDAWWSSQLGAVPGSAA